MAAKKNTVTKSKTVAKTATTKAETARTAVSTATASPTVKDAEQAETTSKKTTAKKRVSKKVTTATVAKKKVAKKAAAKKASVATTRDNAATANATPAQQSAATTANSGANGGFKTFTPYEPAKDEEYMSTQQMEHFRAILLQWKQSLMEEVDRTVGHMKSDATNFPDPNDRATQEEEFSLELRTRDRERKLIKKIDESITKIDEDEYGFCDSCGVEIGIRRLEARPTANMCIECKTLEEIREKQIA